LEDVFFRIEIIESIKERVLPIIENNSQEITFIGTSEREL
jgi:hypothetical protein